MFPGSHTDHSRTGGLVLALGLAFAAQYLFTGEFITRTKDSNTWEWAPRYTLATSLLLAALISAMWAFRQRRDTASGWLKTNAAPGPTLVQTSIETWPVWAAGSVYVTSLGWYGWFGETRLVQLLWLASAALLVIPYWLQSRADGDTLTIPWWEWVLVALITAVGFGLRYWRLTEIPSHLDQDIPFMGWHALQLIETSNYNWIGFSASGHLLSYDQSLAWSMRLFGQNHYGLVMKSVIFGTLTIPALFLLGREVLGGRVGLIAAALLAVSYTHIHFSRILFGPSSTFFAVLTFYFLVRGIRTQQALHFALAGLSGGVALLLYDSSRVIPVIVLALFVWRLIWQWRALRARLSGWIVFATGAAVGFGPMLMLAIQNFESFVGRGNRVMLWQPLVWEHETGAYGTESVIGVLLGQFRNTFLAFHLYGDGSPHFAFPRPMVAALTAALFVLGLAYCLLQLRHARYFLLVQWFLLTFLLGGVITYDPPYWPHLNIALPAVAIIAAIAAEELILLLPPSPTHWSHPLVSSALFVAIAFTALNNWQVYYAFVDDNAAVRSQAARFINENKADPYVYMVSDTFRWNDTFFQFLNQDTQGEDVTADQLSSNPPVADRPLLFVLYRHEELIPFLRDRYPTGLLTEHYNQEGVPSFVSFEVTPDGYRAPAGPAAFNPLALPGWWLVGAVLLLVGGRAAMSLKGQRRATRPGQVLE